MHFPQIQPLRKVFLLAPTPNWAAEAIFNLTTRESSKRYICTLDTANKTENLSPLLCLHTAHLLNSGFSSEDLSFALVIDCILWFTVTIQKAPHTLKISKYSTTIPVFNKRHIYCHVKESFNHCMNHSMSSMNINYLSFPLEWLLTLYNSPCLNYREAIFLCAMTT